jgi:hypothetical protein
MTQNEHLERIKSRCLANLALAEKRTLGIAMFSTVNPNTAQPHYYVRFGAAHVADVIGKDNAAYIAACAGNAEAGWKATIAAIEGFLGHHAYLSQCLCGCTTANEAGDRDICNRCIALDQLEQSIAAILAAWEDSL